MTAKSTTADVVAEPANLRAAPADAVLGHAVWLMLHMPIYRHVFISDLEWMVLPPIMLKQFHLFKMEGRIVAFAAWGYLSEAAEARLQEVNPRLAPADWKSGDRLWLVNLFAPFGHGEIALKELYETVLKGKTFKLHRRTGEGKVAIETIEALS